MGAYPAFSSPKRAVNVSTRRASGTLLDMPTSPEGNEKMAVLAVLAAAAREAQELIAEEALLDRDALEEANRRLKLFMLAARQTAR